VDHRHQHPRSRHYQGDCATETVQDRLHWTASCRTPLGYHPIVNGTMLVHRGSVGRGGFMLKAGQVLYDNDRRYRGRKVEVVRVEGSYAICM
jgi:hypothetical protein